MRRFLLVVLVLSYVILLAQQKPNVLVIITDDAGFNDFGFQHELGAEMGWSDMKPSDIYDASNSFSLTPNLDALAASGTIPQGYYNHQVISLDILATAVEAAELDPSTFTNPIDGVNLVPHIQNNTVAHDFLYWRKMDVWSVVANNDGYKVVVSHEDPVDQTDDIFEMYDLNYSPRESLKNNKFKIHPEETEIFASKKHRNSFKLIRKL